MACFAHRAAFLGLLLVATSFATAGCARGAAPGVDTGGGRTTRQASGGEEVSATQERATPPALPTLLPTHTPPVAATNGPQAATATASPHSTVDFDQPVVELRYRIPALQLDRRLEGNVSGQITVVDETVGVAGIRQNQGGVLLELQEVLPTLELEPVPEGCETCVAFSYSMPLAEAQGEGWLQDPVLLASVENYTSALLGPHFPPGTVLGLRRGATAYDVAHSLALGSDGRLYRWLATASQVDPPVEAAAAAPELMALVDGLEGAELAEQYVVSCVSAPIETLYLHPDATVESGGMLADEGRAIRIVCPAFSLPRALLPVYLQLDGLLEQTLAGSGLPRPPTDVRLDSVLDYRREDGVRLEVAVDGAARITDEAGAVITTTLSSGELVSVTTALLDSGVLQLGLEAFAAGEPENLLLVRGAEGMAEVAWPSGEPPQAIAEMVGWLDELIERQSGNPLSND